MVNKISASTKKNDVIRNKAKTSKEEVDRKTITRTEISEAIAQKIGLTKNDATEVLESVLEEMMQGLINEGYLKLSSFASFNVNKKNKRMGRNPKTGEEKVITPRKTISFRSSDKLKNQVLKGMRP